MSDHQAAEESVAVRRVLAPCNGGPDFICDSHSGSALREAARSSPARSPSPVAGDSDSDDSFAQSSSEEAQPSEV